MVIPESTRLPVSKFQFKVRPDAPRCRASLASFGRRRHEPRLVWIDDTPFALYHGTQGSAGGHLDPICRCGPKKPSLVKFRAASTAAPASVSPRRRVQVSRRALRTSPRGYRRRHLGNRAAANNVSICGKCLSWLLRCRPPDGLEVRVYSRPPGGQARSSTASAPRRTASHTTTTGRKPRPITSPKC